MILYRYRPLNDHTIDGILNHYLYFSKPSSFNDPFDCRFSVFIEGTHYEKVECAKRIAKHHPHSGKLDRKAMERKIVQTIINSTFDYDGFYQGVEVAMDEKTICCLSKVNDDLLMWAHYANGHEGVCLIYDIEKDLFPNCALKVVHYSDDLIKVNLIRPATEHIIPIFTTKSKHWKYEQEYRLISILGKQTVLYAHNCLKGIIFGCKVDKEKKNALIDTIKVKGWLMTFQDAVQGRDRFELIIE